jgi:hypothetical protein
MKKDVDYNVYLTRFTGETCHCWELQQPISPEQILVILVIQEMADAEIFIVP